MTYTRKLGNKFWFEFDFPFNPSFRDVGNEMNDLLNIAFSVLDAYKSCFDTNNNKLDRPCFETAVQNLNVDKQILALASKQLQIMKSNFDSNDDLESAFSDFGQGVFTCGP